MLFAVAVSTWAACGCPGPSPTTVEPGAEGEGAVDGDAGAAAGADAGPSPGKDPVAAGRALEARDAAEARRRFGPAGSAEATDYLAARIAEASGDPAEAARLYEKVVAAGGPLAARGRDGLIRAYGGSDDHAAAEAGLAGILGESAGALGASDRRAAAASRGRHLLALGRAKDAVAAFEIAVPAEAAPGRLTLELARACAAAGDAKRAISLLRPLAEDAAAASTMREAAAQPEELDAAPELDAARRLARARRLIELRAFDDAAEAVAELAVSKNAKIAAEARWLEAVQLYERRRRYAEAIAALDVVIEKGGARKTEARWLRASALARDDREPEAIDAYRDLRKREKQPARAAEALFLASRLAFFIGRHGEALEGMERLVGKAEPRKKAKAKANAKAKAETSRLSEDTALEAHFIAGLCALLEKKAAVAAAHLEAASEGEENAEALLRNRYWLAVARSATAPEKGAALLARICAADPTTWYAALARARLEASGKDATPCALAPIPAEASSPEAEQPTLDALSAPAALLASVGLYREAAEELHDAEEKARPAAAADAFIRHYLALDAPWYAIRRASRALPWPPGAADAGRARAAYPSPFADEVRALERAHGLPRSLLYAVARKESLFDPGAVSRSGALGMMQMMPATYEANRKRAGLPPLPEGALPGPHESLVAASFELEALSKRFEGSLPLVVMAYNGGAAAVAHWVERAGDLPMDVFVEKAGFVETRNYVRRVYQNLVRYRLLEGVEPPMIPESTPGRRTP
ncbi:MAG: lytic transglycosylase domain-containing protein [Proteobacteria bacterium]|nr:lytic transglycosylase domain-containing protein [Pseudomonadota bacterium]